MTYLIHLTLEAECNSMQNAIEWVTLLDSLRIFLTHCSCRPENPPSDDTFAKHLA